MLFIYALFLFVIGICIGSFLNVLIDRLSLGESPVKGRSYADCCKKTLKWHDLIPIFSFLFLQGKCGYCHKKLSFYYPIVEGVTGIVFVICFLLVQNLPQLLFYLLISCFFIVIFFSDVKYGIILDAILFPAVIITFVYHLLSTPLFLVPYLLSGVGACLFFLFIFLVTKGKGMGFGDVKLAFFLGLFLGFPKIIVALYVAFLTGAFVSIILIACGKKKMSRGTIPFGPFLIFGAIIAIFYSDTLLQIFLQGLFL